MASDHVALPALGRPFTLGMLYDARKDKLIPGLKLWDGKTLQEHTVEKPHGSSQSRISTSDTIQSKASLLDIETSLQASFLSGMVQVGASARYLKDTKKFKNQSRVTFQYKATTHFKELSMIDFKNMDNKLKNIIENGIATHVVTGILYGANAFFVFDSEKLESSSVQEIQTSVEVVVNMFNLFAFEASVSVKLTEQEEELINKFSCKYYGDLLLDRNPTTFVEAVKTYVELPKLLRENPVEESVPLKVWLMPLKNLNLKSPDLKTEISFGLVMTLQDALEDLKEMGMRCDDSLDDKVVQKFPQIREDLSDLRNLCNYYASDLQHAMAKALPLIREGKEDESKLEKLFEDRKKSPFSKENVSKWLDIKEREINVIRSCVDMMEGMKIVSDKSELDREILAAGVEDALCFIFTSLETADPFLQELKHFMGPLKPQDAATQPTKDPWCFSDEVFAHMKKKVKDFKNLAKTSKNSSRFRFLVTAIPNEKYKGATIYHYRNGILLTDNFSKPVPNIQTVRDRRDLMWYACDVTLDPETAFPNLALTDGNKRATLGDWHRRPNSLKRFDHYGQVMATEGLTGRCYWEVEWSCSSRENVAVGVSYIGLGRKGDGNHCRIGRNNMSWALGHAWNPYSPHIYVEHPNEARRLDFPAHGTPRLGVYLDWDAGTLSYYKVSFDILTHIHTFKTKFSEPLYPTFDVVCKGNAIFLPL